MQEAPERIRNDGNEMLNRSRIGARDDGVQHDDRSIVVGQTSNLVQRGRRKEDFLFSEENAVIDYQ